MNTNITIQGWLNQLVPLQQISQVVGQVLPAFVIVGVFILAIGYMMMLASSETVLTPSYRLIALFAAIAAAPWFLTIGQTIANALVGAIASFLALGFIICAMIFGFSLGLVFSLAMVVLASAAILYDTSNILHKFRMDQHVAASLSLFASVAMLFYYILLALMQSRR